MARMARVVVPGIPHHVTQRGGRLHRTFFSDRDYASYRSLLGEAIGRAGVDIWAYCLMPNHVHLVAVPARPDSLALLFRTAHRRYTLRVNRREGWQGHLWQERFHSFAMDERHLLTAVRYVELNPVRAGLCKRPEAWPWSSVHAHLRRAHDTLVTAEPMLQRVADWADYLRCDDSGPGFDAIRSHGRTGRPAGSDEFVAELERLSGRRLRPRKTGPKPAIELTVP